MDINTLIHNPLFESIWYKSWDVLYHEWEVDPYIYIVLSWEIIIEKYTDSSKLDTKHLATILSGWVIGEAGMNNNAPKQVWVSAGSDVTLLRIDAQNGIQKLMQEYPTESFEFMKYIISQTNERVLESNSQITATYKITKAISELSEINLKNIFNIIDIANSVLGSTYIIYTEKNPALEWYYNIIYNTNNNWKKSDIIIESNEQDLEKNILLHANKVKNIHHLSNKINIWNEILGYLIFGSHKWFKENDIKIIWSICTAIAGILHRFKMQAEEQNKNSLM